MSYTNLRRILINKLYLLLTIVLVLAFGTVSCSGKDTVRPESSVAPESGMSANEDATEKQAALVVSKQKKDTGKASSDNTSDVTEGSEVSSSKEDAVTKKANTISAEELIDSSYKGDYRLGPGDQLQIEVFQVDELNRSIRVSSGGSIKLPLAGKIDVEGLTVTELEGEISKRLEKYLQDPVVSVYVSEYRSQTITILGAINRPQAYVVTRQNYLLDIISLSGGLASEAGDICYIRRGDETIIVNLKDLLVGGKINLNIPVYSKDIIHVPSGGVVFVSGAVNNAGSYPMKGTVTLTQAIGMASGLAYEASKDSVKIYRDTGSEEREVINVDYGAILAQKKPDMVIKDKDVIIVEKSGIKSFIKSISGVLSIGGVSVTGGL